MHTQCPHCHTVFQISVVHLKAANGNVRCGKCLGVFSALDHLSEKPPQTDPDNMDTAGTNNTSAEPAMADISHLQQIDKNDAEFAELAREFEHFREETDTSPLDNAHLNTIRTTNTDTDTDTNTNIDEIISEILEETRTETTGAAPSALGATNPSTPSNIPLSNTNEAIIIEAEDLEAPGLDIPPTNAAGTPHIDASAGNTKHITADAATIINVPSVIRDDLRAAKIVRLRPSNTFWATGSLLLMLTLLTQAVYLERDSLARDPQYRPWLEQLCRFTGCTLARLYNIRQIDIIGRDVRTHPHADKALIASTTLINKAPFAQPYPLLTLSFSDITGTLLAQRRFTPREYLRPGTDITVGMPSNLPIQVELELVDPGKTALNYEFRAEPAPDIAVPVS
jgi:predicted Zn finger-like uncharacterized protein